MEKIKVVLELTPKEMMRVAEYLEDRLHAPAYVNEPKAPAGHKPDPEPEEKNPEPEEKTPEKPADPAVTLSDLRALGLELTKAGKSKDLKAILADFGAQKLSQVDEKSFADLATRLRGAI